MLASKEQEAVVPVEAVESVEDIRLARSTQGTPAATIALGPTASLTSFSCSPAGTPGRGG